jgi:hypothetical protein
MVTTTGQPPPVNHHRSTTTGQPPPVNHHRSTTTGQPPPVNHHRSTTTGQPPPVNHHRSTTTGQPPPVNHHHEPGGKWRANPNTPSSQPPFTFNRHIFVMTINFKWPITHFANLDRL